MISFHASLRRTLRTCFHAGLFTAAALLAGCASYYVDGSVHEVPVASMAKPAQPKPVQLVVEYQTRGRKDARATEQGRAIVADAVRASGLFSEVRDAPAEGAGVLTVTLNHLPPTENTTGKSLILGATLGLAGQQVTDDYTCTLSYAAPGQAAPIVKTARHAIHTTVGVTSAPPNSWKAADKYDAANTMVRQVLSVTLDELSHDPEFK
jgi:hypothetical protein